MTIVFFIIVFFIIVFLVFVFSTIHIEAKKIYFSNRVVGDVKYNYTILFELAFLGIPFLKFVLDKGKLKKINKKIEMKQRLEKTNWKQVEKSLPSKEEIKKLFKKLDMKLEEFHLDLQIGTEDVILTSGIITLLSSFFGIILAKLIKVYEKEKYEYRIVPLYQNCNEVELKFAFKIKIKILHIIQVGYEFTRQMKKEEKEKKKTWKNKTYKLEYEQV